MRNLVGTHELLHRLPGLEGCLRGGRVVGGAERAAHPRGVGGWTDTIEIGRGRNSVWLRDECDLHYAFESPARLPVDRALLEAMSVEAAAGHGVELTDASLVGAPKLRSAQ